LAKQEVEQTASEMEIQSSRVSLGLDDWGMKPFFSPYCAEHEAQGRYEIEEVKNRHFDCAFFKRKSVTMAPNCFGCRHRVPRGNPYSVLDVMHGSDMIRARREAIEQEEATEIFVVFNGKGVSRNPL